MSIEWPFLIALNEQLRRIRDPAEVQEVAARLLGEHLHASRVHYARRDKHEFSSAGPTSMGSRRSPVEVRSPASAAPS
jgi:hypothetical protein